MNIVIIGAGQAAASLATKLRADGFEGNITIIGDEPFAPYQRPPLSKKYLLGEIEAERLYFRPEEYWSEAGITLLRGQAATEIDPLQKLILLSDGTKLSYDKLVLATGSTPIRLSLQAGGDLEGVYTVRSIEDVDKMRAEFEEGRKLLVIGGGYIGLEAASVASKLGLKVTLVELSERILKRVASEKTATFLRTIHKSHGVDIREGVGIDRLIGEGRVQKALLSDGSEIDVDFVIVGIGIRPEIKLAEAAGLEIENGIKVNAQCVTSDPDIYAAGDCANFPHREGRLRLESVGNAIDMGEAIAAHILGSDKAYQAKPWFWSEQYDVMLQIAGLNAGYDRVITRPGGSEEAVSFWYYQGDKLLSVDAIGDARAYMVGKRLIEAGKSPSPEDIANPDQNLKALLS